MHLIHAFRLGGMENGVVNLCDRHLSAGILHEICSLTDADDFKLRLPAQTPIWELHKPSGWSLQTLWKLVKFTNQRRPQLLHAHNYAGMVYGIATSVLTGVPICLGEHASLHDWERAGWRMELRRLFYNHFLMGVHAVSKDLARELTQDLFGKDQHPKMRALVNGVDTEKFQPRDKRTAKQLLGLDPNLKTLGLAARLAYSKGHEFLLKLFQELKRVGDPVQLLLVGDGGAASEQVIKWIKQHPYGEFIHYLGMRSDMETVYPAMDVMVLPSTSEGLSNACLEAMSCGVPVVTSHSAGAREILPPDGLGCVVEGFQQLDWVFAIRKTLASSEASPEGALQLRQHMIAEFGLERMARDYANFYASLVKDYWIRKELKS